MRDGATCEDLGRRIARAVQEAEIARAPGLIMIRLDTAQTEQELWTALEALMTREEASAG